MIPLDELLKGTLVLDGREQTFELAVQPASEVVSRILQPELATPERVEGFIRTSLGGLLITLDGRRMMRADRTRVFEDPQALGAVLAKRNTLYSTLREQGMLFAQCPHCRGWEADLSIVALIAGLRGGLWEIFTPDGLRLDYLSLSSLRNRGSRPVGIPTSSRLRFELPSARAGLPERWAMPGDRPRPTGGVLGELPDGPRELAAWDRFAPTGADQPEGRSHWYMSNPGFRAILRLSLMLTLDGYTEVTPDVVDALPVVDVLYLDALHHLLHAVDLPEHSGLKLECRACKQRFLPLL